MKIFFSGRIPRDTGGSAAVSFLTNTKKDPESIIPSPFGCNSPYRRKPVKDVPRSKGHSSLERSVSSLRLEAVHITREHRSLADVVQPQQLHGQALQTNAQTAVRRHAVLVQHGEGLK